jgi:hypothetical protein
LGRHCAADRAPVRGGSHRVITYRAVGWGIFAFYAVVTSAAVVASTSSAAARAAAFAYPPAVFGTVVATANHYVLDSLAGSALGIAGLKLARRLGA